MYPNSPYISGNEEHLTNNSPFEFSRIGVVGTILFLYAALLVVLMPSNLMVLSILLLNMAKHTLWSLSTSFIFLDLRTGTLSTKKVISCLATYLTSIICPTSTLYEHSLVMLLSLGVLMPSSLDSITSNDASFSF